MSSTRRLLTLVLGACSALMLAGCLQLGQIVFDNLLGLSGKPLLDPQQGNCVTNELVTREQGYRLAGGIGGFGVDQVPGGTLPSPVVAANDLANQIQLVLGEPGAERDIIILIVDDFRVLKLDQAVFDLDAADLSDPLLGPLDKLDQVLDDLLALGQLAHGPVVMLHTIALLDALPGVFFEGAEGYVGSRGVPTAVANFSVDKRRIAVQAVDTEGFRTRTIPRAIDAALVDVIGRNPEFLFRDAVVNLSFNVIPCSLLRDFALSGADSLDEYMALLADSAALRGLEVELADFVTDPFPNDPLEEYSLGQGGNLPVERAVFVGSAGNYGNNGAHNFTLAPGAWNSVVSVASLDGTSATASAFTNPGEVAFGGAWIVLEAPVGTPFSEFTGSSPHARLAGSSFSAPGVTTFLALDMMAPAPRCTPAAGSTRSLLATGVGGYGGNSLDLAVARNCRSAP